MLTIVYNAVWTNGKNDIFYYEDWGDWASLLTGGYKYYESRGHSVAYCCLLPSPPKE